MRPLRRVLGVTSLALGLLCILGAESAHAQLTNYFVATNGSDANAGTDPNFPLQTIGRAVVLAGGSAVRITVSPGTYQVPATPGFLDLPPGTVLESNEGPFVTTIQGTLGREVIRMNPGGLTSRGEVRGFTITGGQKGIVALAGGQFSRDGAFLIENCIIQDNDNGSTWLSKSELDPFYSFFNSDVGTGGELAGILNVGILAVKDSLNGVNMELTVRNNHIFGNGIPQGGVSSNGIGIWYDVERRGTLPPQGEHPVQFTGNVIYDHEHNIYCTSDTFNDPGAGSRPLIANNVLAQAEQILMLHKRKERVGPFVAQLLPVIVHNTFTDAEPASSDFGAHRAGVKLWGEVRITEMANNLFSVPDLGLPWSADIDIGDWNLYSWPPSFTNLGLNGTQNAYNNGIGAFIQPQNFRRAALFGPRIETSAAFGFAPPVIYRAPPQNPIDYFANYRLVGYNTQSVLENSTLIDRAPIPGVSSDLVRVDLNGDPRLIQYTPVGPYNRDFGADEVEFIQFAHGGSEGSIHNLYRNAATDPGGDTVVSNLIALNPGHPFFEQTQANYQAGMLLDTIPAFIPTAAGLNVQAALLLSPTTAGPQSMTFDGFVWFSVLSPPSWPVGLIGQDLRFTAWTHDTQRDILRGTRELYVRYHRN